jgi:hypothetical protein
MVLPIEEQAAASGQEREGVARTEEPVPLAIGEPEPPQQEEVRAVEAGEDPPDEVPQGIVPQPAEEKQEEPKLAVKYKKVISRKKAGEQARTIIVSVPKEEEEIVDVGVKQRKRGRPRKTHGTDPLDPRKGSVPDPGKGVCADPVNGVTILEGGGTGSPRREQGASVEPR